MIILIVAFFLGLYDILKCLFLAYPIQINIYENSLEIIDSKGKVKEIAGQDIKKIEFTIRSPDCGWYRLTSPNFKFYDSRDKLIVEGDAPIYEQFQEICNRLKSFPVRIYIPNYTEAGYEKFFL